MARRQIWLALSLVLALAVFGCSRTKDKAAQEEGGGASEAETSEAAAARGVATGDGDAEVSTEPRIVLDVIEYEWVLTPEKGLHVALDFINPNQGYGRAKGSVFVIGTSTGDSSVRGVYPWNTTLEGDRPADYSAGGRLLYRTEQRLTLFLPYTGGTGCFDVLRILVYDDDGGVIMDETRELPITGEPTGRQKITQTLAL